MQQQHPQGQLPTSQLSTVPCAPGHPSGLWSSWPGSVPCSSWCSPDSPQAQQSLPCGKDSSQTQHMAPDQLLGSPSAPSHPAQLTGCSTSCWEPLCTEGCRARAAHLSACGTKNHMCTKARGMAKHGHFLGEVVATTWPQPGSFGVLADELGRAHRLGLLYKVGPSSGCPAVQQHHAVGPA